MTSRSLFHSISTTLLSQIVVLFATTISSILISRALQPEGKGVLTFYLTFVNLVPIISGLGIAKGILYEIAQYQGKDNIIHNGVTVSLINAVIAVILAGILITFKIFGSFEKTTDLVVCFALLTVWATVLMGNANAILRGMDLILVCNLGVVLCQLSYLLFIVILYVLREIAFESVVVAYFSNTMLTSIYYFVIISKHSPGLSFDLNIVLKFVRYGLKYFGYSTFTTLHNRIDVIIISFLLTKADLGQYSVGVMFAQILWQIPIAVNFVIFPFIARQSDFSYALTRTAQISRLSIILSTACGIALAIFAPVIVKILYGNAFLPSVEPMRYLMPGIVSFSIVQINSAYLLGHNRIIGLAVVSAIMVVLNVALNFLLIPQWGIRGAALVSSITYTVNALIVAWLVSQEKEVKMVDMLVPHLEDLRLMWKFALRVMTQPARATSQSV